MYMPNDLEIPFFGMCCRENILVNKDTWLRFKCIHTTKYYATFKMRNLDELYQHW